MIEDILKEIPWEFSSKRTITFRVFTKQNPFARIKFSYSETWWGLLVNCNNYILSCDSDSKPTICKGFGDDRPLESINNLFGKNVEVKYSEIINGNVAKYTPVEAAKLVLSIYQDLR